MRGVMMRGAGIRVAFILMLGVAGAAAQAPIETRGAWSLVAHSQDFALRTQALDGPDNTLSLLCRKEQRQFAYEIKSPSLRVRPSGEDIRISFKADDDDQVWFNISTGSDGTVPISHQTASGSFITRSRARPRKRSHLRLATMPFGSAWTALRA